MKISPNWVREFVDIRVDDQQLARDLSSHGINVEGISESDGSTVFEVEFTANRPDTMNHYGVARECSAIFNLDLKNLDLKPLAVTPLPAAPIKIEIEDAAGCARYTARVIRGVHIGASPENVVRRLQLHVMGDGASHPRV